MAGFEPSGGSRLTSMASEARSVDLSRRQFSRIADIRRGQRFHMLAAGPVTRFAGLAGESVLIAGFDSLVRIVRECLAKVLMARRAVFRPNVGWSLRESDN